MNEKEYTKEEDTIFGVASLVAIPTFIGLLAWAIVSGMFPVFAVQSGLAGLVVLTIVGNGIALVAGLLVTMFVCYMVAAILVGIYTGIKNNVRGTE